jgi:hypothetical protein
MLLWLGGNHAGVCLLTLHPRPEISKLCPQNKAVLNNWTFAHTFIVILLHSENLGGCLKILQQLGPRAAISLGKRPTQTHNLRFYLGLLFVFFISAGD